MKSDKTNAEYASDSRQTRGEPEQEPGVAWQRISGGLDGDAFVSINREGVVPSNSGERNNQSCGGPSGELRVLTSLVGDAARLHDLRWRMRLIELSAHPGIRRVQSESLDRIPPSIILALPAPLDPRTDRLCDQIDSFPPPVRLELAARLVDALAAAHRVGLHHRPTRRQARPRDDERRPSRVRNRLHRNRLLRVRRA